jgi:hypothetical protein
MCIILIGYDIELFVSINQHKSLQVVTKQEKLFDCYVYS